MTLDKYKLNQAKSRLKNKNCEFLLPYNPKYKHYCLFSLTMVGGSYTRNFYISFKFHIFFLNIENLKIKLY